MIKKIFGAQLDDVIIEHLELSLAECDSLEEKQELLEPYVLDAGLDTVEVFKMLGETEEMAANSNENIPAVEEGIKKLQVQEKVKRQGSESVFISPKKKERGKTKNYGKDAGKVVGNVVEKGAKDTNEPSDEPSDKLDSYSAVLEAASTTQPIGKRMQAVRKAKKNSQFSETIEQDVGLIEATTIQSRFHSDTVETLSNDIDMKKLTITIGGRPVLVDADLRLFSGVKYGLVGRNGVGKSTLFKAMGYGIIPGFPKNIRVLFVEQLEGISAQTTVLDAVLEADLKSIRAKKDFEILSNAQESGNNRDIAKAIREIELGRLEDELKLANQIAIKRSGARGNAARIELLVQEVQVGEARANVNSKIPAQEAERAPAKAMEMMQELHEQLELFDFNAAEAKVQKILKGLGFSEEWVNGPIGNLSGGWRIRVSLAQALFMEPDVLLLDEPTNHLDLPAILWLKAYLQSLQDVTVIVISHDRSFLNDIIDETIIFRNQQLTYFPGKYDEYTQNMEETLKNNLKVASALEKKRTHIEKSIQEGLKQAKSKGDDKKLQMVASRKKKLEERFGVERSASGHRFKLNKDMVGYFDSNRMGVNIDKGDAAIKWNFPPPSILRSPGSLVQVEQVSFHYVPGKTILKNVTLNVQMGDRIGIVGANGDGKSTLIQLIVGKLSPIRGRITLHPQVKIGYYSQTFVDEIAQMDPKVTTIEYLKSTFPDAQESEIRGHFGGFGIGGDQMSLSVSSLSGGQAVRVATGVAVWSHPQLLILDEPSNHLDMDSVTAVIEAIASFEGAVILVSHDQYLVEQATNQVYLMRDQQFTFLEGGVRDYIKLLKKGIKI